MRKDVLALLVLSLALSVLIIFFPEGGFRLRGGVAGIKTDVSSSEPNANAAKSGIKSALNSGVEAFVYSRYPFGLKNELLISAGEDRGISAGDTAVFEGFFVGTVKQVFKDSALLKTIFDPSFKASARIGKSGANSLLIGGSEPQLTLIESRASVAANDLVISAGTGAPYGLSLGRMGEARLSSDRIFQEAPLVISYNLDDVTQVVVVPSPQKR